MRFQITDWSKIAGRDDGLPRTICVVHVPILELNFFSEIRFLASISNSDLSCEGSCPYRLAEAQGSCGDANHRRNWSYFSRRIKPPGIADSSGTRCSAPDKPEVAGATGLDIRNCGHMLF